MPADQNTHPYDALTAHIDDLQSCYDAIEDAKERLRRLQKTQDVIIRAALRRAHDENDLKPLAQYLYLDAPAGIWRDIVKTHVGYLVHKGAQQWLCEGYTCDTTCCDCGVTFPYQVTSFTDLQDLKKPHRAYKPSRTRKRYDRCPTCQHNFTQGNQEASRKRREAEDAVRHYLRQIPYRDYLQTEHWQSIRSTALRRARFRCQLCNASGQLHVHHRSYEHRGEEHNHMHDVIVLCVACHTKHHDLAKD